MAGLKEQMLGSDMVVFATPLYYFGMSAQLKTVIDRLYSFTGQLSAKGLRARQINEIAVEQTEVYDDEKQNIDGRGAVERHPILYDPGAFGFAAPAAL